MTNLQHQLDGVMHFVDKWFDDDDPRLLEDPVSRANHAREIALKWGESLEAKLIECQKKSKELARILDSLHSHGLIDKTSEILWN